MNHRDRVLTALHHREPDRVPIDLGGTTDSTIMAVGYPALRKHLGLEPSITRVSDVCQHTALIQEDVRQALELFHITNPDFLALCRTESWCLLLAQNHPELVEG